MAGTRFWLLSPDYGRKDLAQEDQQLRQHEEEPPALFLIAAQRAALHQIDESSCIEMTGESHETNEGIELQTAGRASSR
jgi:hypothetical protein